MVTEVFVCTNIVHFSFSLRTVKARECDDLLQEASKAVVMEPEAKRASLSKGCQGNRVAMLPLVLSFLQHQAAGMRCDGAYSPPLQFVRASRLEMPLRLHIMGLGKLLVNPGRSLLLPCIMSPTVVVCNALPPDMLCHVFKCPWVMALHSQIGLSGLLPAKCI